LKLFTNSVIALSAGFITYFIVSQFTAGDMRIIVAMWVTIICAMVLNFYTKLKKT
jgi:hypothetical protein